MPLPAGINLATITYGKRYAALGTQATIEGTVEFDRTLVWAATGEVLDDFADVVTSNAGGFLTFQFPFTDQPGFTDGAGNEIVDFAGVLKVTIRYGSKPHREIVKPFQVPTGAGTVDLDLVPDGQITLPVVAPTPVVTSVAGFTNAVSVEDLQSVLGGGEQVSYGSPVSARIDIVTAGKAAITSKETYLPATIAVSGVPGVADYAGVCQIRGRGNYTWTLPKKPYKLKFADDVPLMGMPAFDDWALLANHTDPSKINNALAFELGRQADGLDWTPRSEFAHLYLNGAYAGLYQLTETVKRGDDRVDVQKAGTTGLALTGGYLLEIDQRGYDDGDPGFITDKGVKIIFDDPGGTDPVQAAAVEAAVQTFETALYADTWLDPTLGYARYVDLPSFVDWYLIQELASNQDSSFGSSCKFYKHRDTASEVGRIHMGPLWDFDIAFGSVVNEAHPSTGYYTRLYAEWFIRMFGDPAFMGILRQRWTAFKARLEDEATGYSAIIDALTARTASAALADQDEWAYTSDWATVAAFKKQWLAERIEWLDGQFIPPSVTPGATTNLTAGDPTDTTVALSWTRPVAVAGGAIGDYVVQYRETGDTTWQTFADGSSLATSATVTGLDSGTDYEFRVAATNVIGSGAWSNTASATTATGTIPGAFADDFNRADSGTTLGADWTALAGVWGVHSGAAGAEGGGGGGVVKVAAAGVAQGNYQATATKTVDGGDGGAAILARVQNADNFYMLLLNLNNGLLFYKRVSGGFDNLGSFSNVGVPQGSTVTLEANGSAFRVLIGGVQVGGIINDATFASGPPGLRSDFGSTRFDNFVVTPL